MQSTGMLSVDIPSDLCSASACVHNSWHNKALTNPHVRRFCNFHLSTSGNLAEHGFYRPSTRAKRDVSCKRFFQLSKISITDADLSDPDLSLDRDDEIRVQCSLKISLFHS